MEWIVGFIAGMVWVKGGVWRVCTKGLELTPLEVEYLKVWKALERRKPL